MFERKITNGDLLIGVTIFVTTQGVVYWDIHGGDAPAGPGGELQACGAKLGVIHSLGEVRERMNQAIKDRK